MEDLFDILKERRIDFRKKGQMAITENAIFMPSWDGYDIMVRARSPREAVDAVMGSETCEMEVASPEKIMSGWLFCDYCGPVYPPVAPIIQEAVRFCPLCGRKVRSLNGSN